MNCCDDYGKCTQGPNCAAREEMTITKPVQKKTWLDLFVSVLFVLSVSSVPLAAFVTLIFWASAKFAG